MHNPATAFFTAEDKQRHPYLSSVLEPSTQKVIATAAVRVYYAPFINAHLNWTYSNLRGILVFGRDRQGLPPGVPPPPPDRGITTHGLRLKENYWFRLVDIKTDRVVWMFSVPEVFEYNKDKPFFHFFSGTVCGSHCDASNGDGRGLGTEYARWQTRMFGFCFDDDGEAAVFYKKVVDRTRRHSIFRPFRSNSVKREREMTKTPSVPAPPQVLSLPSTHTNTDTDTTVQPSTTKPNPKPTPTKPKSSTIRFKPSLKPSSLRPNISSLISSPAPHSFVHVSHVGVGARGMIESSKNIEPAWGALIADLQGYGIGASSTGEAPGSESSTSSCPVLSSPSPPPEKKRKIRRKVLIL
ncbi:hypothetical protein JVU11DRAFT_9892 [Chiua virens]|nr:hypothetical protein JVU11DRAFT_9892 [Chiua virens]